MAKKTNMYSIQTWIDEGLSREEAEAKVKDLKSKTSGTLDNFIRRHGSELGPIKFEEFKNKSKNNLENFIKRYGEKGPELFQAYKKNKDSMSKEFFKKKFGEDWKAHYTARKASVRIDYSWAVRVHGKNADKVYEELCKKKTEKLFEAWPTQASKQSLSLFAKTLEYLDDNQVEYHIGIKGKNSELRIWCSSNKRLYYYDLAIPRLGVIVEYNGNHVHPRESDLGTDWKCSLRGLSVEEVWEADQHKKQLALANGYTHYIQVFSDDFKKAKQEESDKLLAFVKEQMKEISNEDNSN